MKQRSKKLLALLLVGVMSMSLLAGCGDDKKEAPAEATDNAEEATAEGTDNATADDNDVDPSLVNTELEGEITQWVWGDYESRGAADFNKYYPNIKVNYVAVPDGEYNQKVMTALAVGTDLPDIVNIESGPRGQFLNMDGVWERLDVAPYNLDPDELLPIAKSLTSNAAGEILCVQVDNCIAGIVYDRNLAKKYFGTDDPEEMEEIFSSLDVMLEKSAEVGAGGDYMFASVDCAYSVVSGLFIEEPVVLNGKLNTDVSILPTYEFIEGLVANNAAGPYIQWSPAWHTSFTTGDVLFYRGPAWFISHMMKPNDPDSEGRWGLMTPPGGGFNDGGTAYAIPQQIDEKQKELAWTYIKWLTMSQEGAESFWKAHHTQTLYAAAYETDLYEGEPDPFFAGQNATAKLNEIAEHPDTTASIMTEHDSLLGGPNGHGLRDLEDGMSAKEAYEKYVNAILEIAPEIAP